MFSLVSLMDMFTSSLKRMPLSIFIITILTSLSYASAMVYYSGPTVVRLLGSGGSILINIDCASVLLSRCLGL